VRVFPGIAAGHPATADAGLEILSDGGTAADAAVAATLASCVAETLMTGLAGGGYAVWYDAARGDVRVLDFFVAVPGLGSERRDAELLELEVPFGTELVHYAVGIASCAVPGIPAGLEELWRSHGRLPWSRLAEPAIRLARDGVVLPPAHAACLAMLAPVMTMREGSRIYAPAGRLLEAGERLEQPGLAEALTALAAEGARTFREGTLAGALLALMAERGGLVTAADLGAYRPIWHEPDRVAYAGRVVAARVGLRPLTDALARLSRLRGLSFAEQAVALAEALADGPDVDGDTTNLSVVDPDGNACVVTTSLGLGSGDFLAPYDLHLNSMLGEADLLLGSPQAGERMASMMSPCVALDDDRLVAAAGAAGGTRLRSALVRVLAGVLDEGVDADEAVKRPRLHPAGDVVHVEPGWDPDALVALADGGLEVREWAAPHHYFGGVSLLARIRGAGDPRRNGSARALE
jgi:gamma-glutamyltranspeptidase/glutathione hydrolase